MGSQTGFVTQTVTVIEDTLSDGSIAHGVLLRGEWGTVKLDCVDEQGAYDLANALSNHVHDFTVIAAGREKSMACMDSVREVRQVQPENAGASWQGAVDRCEAGSSPVARSTSERHPLSNLLRAVEGLDQDAIDRAAETQAGAQA